MSLGSFLKRALKPTAGNILGTLLDPAGQTIRNVTGTPNTMRGFVDPSGLLLQAPQGGGGDTGVANPLLGAPQGGALPPISTGPMGFYSQLAWQLAGSPALRQQMPQQGLPSGYYSPPPRFAYPGMGQDVRLPSQASLLGRSA